MAAPLDVVVIGAGIVGIMAATFLQREGRRVVVFDRDGVAQGASFANAGALAFSDILPLASPGILRKAPRWLFDPTGPLSVPPAYALHISPWLWRFWRASRQDAFDRSVRAQTELMRLARAEMHRTVALAGLDAMLRSDGCLELYETETEFASSRANWDLRARGGIEFRHVDRDGIDELQPGLAPVFQKGTFVPKWQTVSDPREFTQALADRVVERGGLVERATVRSLQPRQDGVEVVLADGGSARARDVVVACGAWSKPLAAQLGDAVPLETERGYNTTLPPGSFDLRRQLTFGGHGFVATPLSTGIRIGGAVELGGLRRAPNHARSAAMLAKAKRFMPDLRTDGGRQWMGYRPSMPDSLPVIGHAAASRNVVYAFGHGHLGLTQSAATGRLVADLVGNRASPIDMTPFRPSRFRGE